MTRRRTASALVLLSLVSTLAEAKVERVLHEPVPEELYKLTPQEPGLAARGTAAQASAAGGGQAGAPSPRGGAAGEPSGAAAHDEAERFTIDRDTRRPNVLPYSDPFEPSVAPFKRLHAYDAVADSYVLSEGGEPRHEVTPTAAEATDVVFKAQLTLPIESGVPVRLPTPGPGAHLLAAEASVGGKPVSIVIRTDTADNWDLEATVTGTLTLTLRVAVSPDAFGGDFGDPRWDSLPPIVPLPPRAQNSAAQVTRAIGVSRTRSVREAVSKLVAHFRSFQESNEPPPPSGDVYLDLALSKKGVCRHRAFAFLITARSLGIPTRMLTNEAHAWVEVHNGTRWKRIDLGGAGGSLEAGVQPPMTPPPDPFAWPEGANRGSDLASRSSARATGQAAGSGAAGAGGAAQGGSPGGGSGAANGNGTNGNGTNEDGANANGPATTPSAPAADITSGAANAEENGETATIEVQTSQPNTKRGGMLPVRGTVSSNGRACAHASVVISLREQHSHAPSVILGTIPARDDGSFESSVFVPRELPPGDYQVLAQSPGNARCGKNPPR